jgi:aspartyl-tRNA(Asn)/glutamyl-tRNA(Gln) amidotransferase subunit C
MADFTREDVLKLARLARIDLDEAEIERFTAEFAEILKYVEQLQKVDVAGLEPTSQVTGLTNVMRPDVVHDYGYKVENLLNKNVPAVENGQIKVKRMIG